MASERDKSMRMHPSQQRFRSGAPPARRAAREDPGADRIGVIVCTRAPGLVEQLARTGAVVVLDPEREGIVRAAGDLGLSQVRLQRRFFPSGMKECRQSAYRPVWIVFQKR